MRERERNRGDGKIHSKESLKFRSSMHQDLKATC